MMNAFVIEATDGVVRFETNACMSFIKISYMALEYRGDKIHDNISWLCGFFKLNGKQLNYTVLV